MITMMSPEATLARNIRRLRALLDMTQEEFAEMADVSYTSVSKWENGKAIPRIGKVDEIARRCGLSRSNIMDEGGMDRVTVEGGRLVDNSEERREALAAVYARYAGLTDDERVVVRAYRSASDDGGTLVADADGMTVVRDGREVIALDEEEAAIVRAYRSMGARGRRMLSDTAEAFAASYGDR